MQNTTPMQIHMWVYVYTFFEFIGFCSGVDMDTDSLAYQF